MQKQLLEEAWEDFKEKTNINARPKDYVDNLRIIYFAGALALFKVIVYADSRDLRKIYNELSNEFDGIKQKP